MKERILGRIKNDKVAVAVAAKEQGVSVGERISRVVPLAIQSCSWRPIAIGNARRAGVRDSSHDSHIQPLPHPLRAEDVAAAVCATARACYADLVRAKQMGASSVLDPYGTVPEWAAALFFGNEFEFLEDTFVQFDNTFCFS